MRGPSRAEITSAAEKAANTQLEETPRSRAIGSAKMAGKYMLDAHASVCVVPSPRMMESGRALMAYPLLLFLVDDPCIQSSWLQ